MALNADNVLVATTGSFYADTIGTGAVPTGTASALTTWGPELGYVSDDGISLTMPKAGDTTSLKAWQNGATVRKLHSPSEDSPQLVLTLIETKLEVLEYVFGVVVTATAAEGSFVINTNAIRGYAPIVLDVVDGANLFRIWAPRAILTAVGEIKLDSSDAIGWAITIDLEYDSTIDGNAEVWMTSLKTAA